MTTTFGDSETMPPTERRPRYLREERRRLGPIETLLIEAAAAQRRRARTRLTDKEVEAMRIALANGISVPVVDGDTVRETFGERPQAASWDAPTAVASRDRNLRRCLEA